MEQEAHQADTLLLSSNAVSLVVPLASLQSCSHRTSLTQCRARSRP